MTASTTVVIVVEVELDSTSTTIDGNGATVRTILFDYRKAFDFTDHNILIDKLCKLDLPRSVVNWIIELLTDRFQRIKQADSCYSEWGSVPSGIPQGTKLRP